MDFSHRYQAYPTGEVAERLEHHIDVHRQLYNHVRSDYEQAPEDDKPSEYDQNNKLPEWKRKWPVFAELHSKAAQATVARFYRNLSTLHKMKGKGGHRWSAQTASTQRLSECDVQPVWLRPR